MTCAYVTWMLIVWGLLPAASIGGLVAAAFAVVLLVDENSDVLGHVLVALAVLLLLYSLVCNTRGNTARTLAGTLPCTNWFVSDRTPTSLEDLNRAIKKLRRYKGTTGPRVYPSIVGSGWGYFTMRRGAAGSRIFMHRLSGVKSVDHKKGLITFFAGSTTLECVRTLRKTFTVKREEDGREYPATFWSHPTLSHISIGSWFGCSNHGNTGPMGQPSSYAVAKLGLQVWDMSDNDPMSNPKFLSYQDARELFDRPKYAREHLIVAVTFARDNLAPDFMVQKKLTVVRDEASAEEWLFKSKANLRVLFMGSGRTVGLGLSWKPVYKPEVTRGLFFWLPCWRVQHIDEHDCGLSRLTRVTQLDTCSAVGGCYEGCYTKNGGDSWRGISTLSDANLWSPLTMLPIAPLTVALVGLLNFEIICRLPNPGMTPDALWRLVDGLTKMHREGRCWPFYRLGRTEIRYKKATPDGVLFLDCALQRRDMHRPFEVLKKVTDGNLEKVALHSGKYRGADLGQVVKDCELELVPPYMIYYLMHRAQDQV